MRRHQERAWRIAWRLAGDRDEASDLVQDAFERILEGVSRYRPEGRFPAFLRTVLVRRHLDLRARHAATPSADLDDATTPLPGPEARLAAIEEGSAVARALAGLAPDQRVALVLRHYEDLRYQEIAELLGTTPKGVENLLRRGRERLAILLREAPTRPIGVS